MKTIKFRGLRVDGKGWVYGNYIEKIKPTEVNNTFWCCFIHDQALLMYEVIPESVGQFTGLQDKNGVDIYEGDNIRVCDNKNGLLTVVFVNEYVGGWVLIHESTKNKLSLGARKSNTIEVIGNIHEK